MREFKRLSESHQQFLIGYQQEVSDAKQAIVTANEQLEKARASYHSAILQLLGAHPGSSFAPWAENILSYCDQESLDPEWFYENLTDVYRSGPALPGGSMTAPDRLSTHADFALLAIYHANKAKYHSSACWDPVATNFIIAADLAMSEEARDINYNPHQRTSAVYRWFVENDHVLEEVFLGKRGLP